MDRLNESDLNDILNGWNEFLCNVNKNPQTRPITMEAWKRCSDMGLSPEKIKLSFLNDTQLENKLKENSYLIEIVKPYLESISLSLAGLEHIIALSDCEGWIIDIKGTYEKVEGKKVGFCLGASWAECNIGNNGIGTALSLRQTVMVYGIEHFGKAYGSWACIGVPIFFEEKLIGALDISVPVEYASPERLSIAQACVTSIQSALCQLCSNKSESIFENNELIAAAIHDLKNPLAVIRGLGELGRLTSNNERSNSYFTKVIKQADELNSMLIELLSIYKPQVLTPEKVVPIITDIMNSYEAECKNNNIHISFINNCDERVNICISLFKRSISNLIINAIQNMNDGGHIKIKTESMNDSLIISISDTAGGIPEDLRDDLFKPFTYRRKQGTGLGLFMVYHTITDTFNGEIWYETLTGIGTTFYIKLPLVKLI